MPIQTEFSDEQLVSISIRSYSIDECVQAMAFCYFKIDELKTQVRSQANNRRRKYYEYMFGQIKKRMTKLEIQAERRATNKRLRRHETKAKSEVILESLIVKLINARGNTTNHPTTSDAKNLAAIQQQEIITGDKAADESTNSIRAKVLELKAQGVDITPDVFKQISLDARKTTFTHHDLTATPSTAPDLNDMLKEGVSEEL